MLAGHPGARDNHVLARNHVVAGPQADGEPMRSVNLRSSLHDRRRVKRPHMRRQSCRTWPPAATAPVGDPGIGQYGEVLGRLTFASDQDRYCRMAYSRVYYWIYVGELP